MNAALPDLLRAIRRSLNDAVLPELSSDHARGQVAAIEDILGKVELMAVWSPEAIEQQAQVLREGCAAFVARAAGEALVSPEIALATEAQTGTLPALEAQVMRLTDWLFDAPPDLGRTAAAELHAILRQTLRQQLVIQRKLIPLTNFGAMTAAGPKS